MNKGIAIFILVAIIFSLAVFFIYVPFIRPPDRSLSELKDYFSIVAVFSGSTTALFGLILGAYYYYDKRAEDKANAKSKIVKEQIDYILKELEKYEGFVYSLISEKVKSEFDLKKAGGRVHRGFDNIYSLLQKNDGHFEFTHDEQLSFIRFYGFVDKNDGIMSIDFADYLKINFDDTENEFLDHLRDVRKICFHKASDFHDWERFAK